MKYKTCWISDLHLGCNKSQVHLIYKFLKENEFETLYLVGDIIDIWRMKQSGFLNAKAGQQHINIIQRILKLAKKGTHVWYIYGNHDEFVSNFIDEHNEFGNIRFAEKVVHTSQDGKRYIVIHGHQFDLITRYHPWISQIGDSGYEALVWINRIYNQVRYAFGFGYWSLSKYIKVKVKKAASFISNYADSVAKYAKDHDCDGIICGHIHCAEIKTIHNKKYINCGCWTDLSSCNAVVETESGELVMINYGEKQIVEKCLN